MEKRLFGPGRSRKTVLENAAVTLSLGVVTVFLFPWPRVSSASKILSQRNGGVLFSTLLLELHRIVFCIVVALQLQTNLLSSEDESTHTNEEEQTPAALAVNLK